MKTIFCFSLCVKIPLYHFETFFPLFGLANPFAKLDCVPFTLSTNETDEKANFYDWYIIITVVKQSRVLLLLHKIILFNSKPMFGSCVVAVLIFF